MNHFESAPLVSGWDDPTKLLWFRERLTKRAQMVWKRPSVKARATYEGAKEASDLNRSLSGNCTASTFKPRSGDQTSLGPILLTTSGS